MQSISTKSPSQAPNPESKDETFGLKCGQCSGAARNSSAGTALSKQAPHAPTAASLKGRYVCVFRAIRWPLQTSRDSLHLTNTRYCATSRSPTASVLRTVQSFEIRDIPIRWYTFKKRPVQSSSALDLELPEEAGGEPSKNAVEGGGDDEGGGGDDEGGDDESVEDVPEEVLPQPSALKAIYARGAGENFLLAMGGWARGAIFECSWEVRMIACKRSRAPQVRLVC